MQNFSKIKSLKKIKESKFVNPSPLTNATKELKDIAKDCFNTWKYRGFGGIRD